VEKVHDIANKKLINKNKRARGDFAYTKRLNAPPGPEAVAHPKGFSIASLCSELRSAVGRISQCVKHTDDLIVPVISLAWTSTKPPLDEVRRALPRYTQKKVVAPLATLRNILLVSTWGRARGLVYSIESITLT